MISKWSSKALIAVVGFILMLIPMVQAEEFRLSYSCTGCHQDRYDEWSRSMHALAVSDPVYKAAYLKAVQSDPENRYYCLTCHSPATGVTKDFNLTKSISIEGITCSVCHTVSRIENGKLVFDQTDTMRGPYSNYQVTESHASTYSELLTKSEFCAGCHEFSMNGVPISETYTEWKAGPYAAEGTQCQDCHMEAKSGPAVKGGPGREKVYQHFWYGGHSGQFLEKAIKMDTKIERTGNRVKATLNITNSNVGHKIPSGLPSRKVILSFKAVDQDGNVIFNDQKIYAKTIIDAYGNEVEDFWKAASIASDNRIRPEETRTEVFEFEVPDGTGKLDTRATLTYQLESEILMSVPMKLEVAKASGTALMQSGTTEAAGTTTKTTTTEQTPGTGWFGTVIALIAALLYIRRAIK